MEGAEGWAYRCCVWSSLHVVGGGEEYAHDWPAVHQQHYCMAT